MPGTSNTYSVRNTLNKSYNEIFAGIMADKAFFIERPQHVELTQDGVTLYASDNVPDGDEDNVSIRYCVVGAIDFSQVDASIREEARVPSSAVAEVLVYENPYNGSVMAFFVEDKDAPLVLENNIPYEVAVQLFPEKFEGQSGGSEEPGESEEPTDQV